MQVTAKLAALYVQGLQQQQTQSPVLSATFQALHTWLVKANPLVINSPQSNAAAAVRQQLQESQLLQHLGTTMDAAAARLQDAAAASLSATTSGSSSSGGSSSSTGGSCSIEQGSIPEATLYMIGETHHSSCLLKIFLLVNCPLSPSGTYSIEAVLPAVPAATRLMHSVFQTYHIRPQLQLFSRSNDPLPDVCSVLLALAWAIDGDVQRTLQSCPEASKLLLLPELLSCLAVMLVATVLGLHTRSDSTEPQFPSRQELQLQQQQ
jgi:hypothetical protein